MFNTGFSETRILQGAVLIACVSAGAAANANTFELDGVIGGCLPLVCNQAGIGVGDPIVGYIAVDDAVSGATSSFTAADVQSYLISVAGLAAGSNDATLDVADGTTDGQGNLVAGTIAVSGMLPDLGANLAVDINITAGTWEASTDFLNLGTVASGTIAFSQGVSGGDLDGDQVADRFDNCTEMANIAQVDSNGDQYGNACDADLNDDLLINFIDLGQMKAVFFTADADADLNSDGQVNFLDLGAMKSAFFGAPGPSGLVP